MEIWKKISGFHNRYSVSSWGRVRNDETGHIRTPNKMKKGVGYLTVAIKEGGKCHTLYLHHLVAAAFLGPTPLGQEIRHVDGNPDNCRDDNLEFGTRKQNLQDKKRHGTQTRGETHPTSRLAEKQVLEIRRRVGSETQTSLAQEFGVALMTVNKIVTRKTWAHV